MVRIIELRMRCEEAARNADLYVVVKPGRCILRVLFHKGDKEKYDRVEFEAKDIEEVNRRFQEKLIELQERGYRLIHRKHNHHGG